jgi:hypothetical protein
MKLQMQLSQMEQVLIWKLMDIAWINNLESTSLIESLEMIKDKGLDNEVIYEVKMTPDRCLDMLKSRMAFRNHCQRRFKKIVEYHLAECNNNSLPS